LRLLSPRARAAVLGSLALSVPVAAPVAAQTPAPAPAAVPTAPAPGAKTASRAKARPALRVTRRALNVRAGRTARVSGTLRPGRLGRVVTLERRSGTRWTTIDKARTTRGGRFALAYRTRRVDTSTVRVRFAGDRGARPARRTLGRLNVFRPALASWYGPGLFGNALGCGGRLHPGTLGVAHKSLPCGTRVTLRKGDRILRVRVIDRGPYVGAREFDLTQATKHRLGFGSTGTVDVAH
jgi:hypothetical protein